MVDLILRGGTVIDGTGRPRYPADGALVGDRIAAIVASSATRAHWSREAPGTVSVSDGPMTGSIS